MTEPIHDTLDRDTADIEAHLDASGVCRASHAGCEPLPEPIARRLGRIRRARSRAIIARTLVLGPLIAAGAIALSASRPAPIIERGVMTRHTPLNTFEVPPLSPLSLAALRLADPALDADDFPRLSRPAFAPAPDAPRLAPLSAERVERILSSGV